ncbi:MAG: hypothetical protein HY072_00160 [Deltaproteobacteria bacterium]|nr:hypothetical protein [Deltaproteobacteria bacterium]
MTKKQTILLIGSLLLIGLFQTATLREGHRWNTDFGMYIHHAENLLQGNEYGNVHYIFNPHQKIHPRSYPPIFPIFLAPVYYFFGFNLKVMKDEQILFFLFFLFVFVLGAMRHFSFHIVLFSVWSLGISPAVMTFKEDIMAYFLFLIFLYSTLILI